MAQKRRRKKKYSSRNSIRAIITILCIVVVALFISYNSGENLSDTLADIWNNTLNNSSGTPVNTTAAKLVDWDTDSEKLIYYIIDTGNSDSMVIRTPEGNSILVDAADSDDFDKISGTLKALKINKLDAVVATHPDSDHIGSMAAVIKAFRPTTIYMPDYTKNTSTFQNMLKAIEASNTQSVIVTAPYRFSLGSVEFSALSPLDKTYDDPNNASITLLMQYGDASALLTGDIEKPAIADLLSNFPEYLDIDVLKVGHHGSSTSTTKEFLNVTTPSLAIITCGKDNDYGHPHKETISMLKNQGIETVRTDKNGDIIVLFDGSNQFEYRTAA